MKFQPDECQNYTFAQLSNQNEKEYDYLWFNEDSNMHLHEDFYELFFLAGGTATHYYNGKEQELGKNWVFFFKPGEFHQLYTKPYQSFHFSFIAKEKFLNKFFHDHPVIKDAFENKNCLSYEMTDVEFEYIYRLANNLTHKIDEYEEVSLFLYNIISLLKKNNGTKQEVIQNNFVLDLVGKFNNYKYLTCRIEEIYKNYPIARCTLIKEFKQYTGMTLVQYQRKVKLVYASQLLINSGYTVIEIAEKLKFDSLSHFLRIFKQEYGMTPKQYRKTHMR